MVESAIPPVAPELQPGGTEEAANAIKKLLSPEPEDSPTGEETEEDAVEDEEPAIEVAEESDAEDTEEDAEPEEIPAIDAPTGWSEADREEFASLPPAIQQKLATREREREQLLSQSNRAATDRRSEYESHLSQIETERQGYKAQLEPVLERLASDFLASNDQLRQLLEDGDTQGWAELKQVQEDRQRQLDDGIAQHKKIMEAEANDAKVKAAEAKREQAKELLEIFPEWKDPEKGKAAFNAIVEYATTKGFTQEDVANIGNAKVYGILDDARKWRDFESGKKKIVAKKIKAKPKVIKPGSSGPKVDKDVEGHRRDMKNLRENPKSLDAFATVLKGM